MKRFKDENEFKQWAKNLLKKFGEEKDINDENVLNILHERFENPRIIAHHLKKDGYDPKNLFAE